MVLSVDNEAIYAEDAVVAATIKGGGSEINPTLPDDLQSILTPSPSSHAPSSSNTSSNQTALMGEVGYIFRKQFTAGWFTGKVIEIIADPGECYFCCISLLGYPCFRPLINLSFAQQSTSDMIGDVYTPMVIRKILDWKI